MTREPSYQSIVKEFNEFILHNKEILDLNDPFDIHNAISKKWKELTTEYVNSRIENFNKEFFPNE